MRTLIQRHVFLVFLCASWLSSYNAIAEPTGTVVAWGYNEYGQTDVPVGLSNVVAVAAGWFHNLALKSNGTVVAWGHNYDGQTNVPVGLTNVVAIASGFSHNLALKGDQTVVAWGQGAENQTAIPSGLSNVIAVAAGQYHSLVLKSDGTVVAWGATNNYSLNQTNVPPNLTDVISIAASGWHSAALRSDGTVVAWGLNDQGQTNVPLSLSNIVSVVGGGNHTLALISDGMVTGWGNNDYGQLSVPVSLSNVVAVSSGGWHHLAIKNDGSLIAWGANVHGQANIPLSLSNVIAVAGGGAHSLALVSDGYGIRPLITMQPQSQNVDYSTNVTFSVAALGSIPLTFQWRKEGVNISGQTNATLFLTNVETSAIGNYSVTVLNSAGSVTSSIALLNVIILEPNVLSHPQSQTAQQGSTVYFSVVASGTPMLSYQWLKDGIEVGYGNNATLILTNIQLNTAGNYSVIVSNFAGTNVSASALLTVVVPPLLTDEPQSQTASVGNTVMFNAAASGSLPLFYQWRKNGVSVASATNATLNLSNIQLTDIGSYDLIVTNIANSVTSRIAQLFIIHPATGSPYVVNGFVVGVNIIQAGYGYTNTPVVKLIGGGGTGAQAVAVVSDGVVIAINVINAGFGYTSQPLVVIAPPYVRPPSLEITCASLLSFSNLTSGNHYQFQQMIMGEWVNLDSFTATSTSHQRYVEGLGTFASYRLARTPVPTAATATAQLINGFVVAAIVNFGGSGYVSAPTVQIVNGGGGGATGTTTITNGVVIGITITSAGYGYTSIPTIQISPPSVVSEIPGLTPAVRLIWSGLLSNQSYQLETASTLGNWTNLSSPLFVTNIGVTQYLNTINSRGFFRLRHEP